MIVICDKYKKCTNKECSHLVNHEKNTHCDSDDCNIFSDAKCEENIRETRRKKMKKIDGSNL